MVERDVRDGVHRNPEPGAHPEWFTTAYLHRPADVRAEMEAAGFRVEALLAIEGPASYRYFTGKDAVLSPIVTDEIDELAERLAARPAPESLATALHNAYQEITPRQGQEGVRALIGLFLDVPALRAQWHEGLRKLEAALIPVVHKRARRLVTDYHAELSAAAAVTGLRVALERASRSAPPASPADTFSEALTYLRDGAKL